MSGEDIQSEDAADAEHWVSVYAELVDFSRTVAERSDEMQSQGGTSGLAQDPNQARLTLQSKVQELHLAYWVERLNRLREQRGRTVSDLAEDADSQDSAR